MVLSLEDASRLEEFFHASSVISYDFFDTLFVRSVGNPEDVFDLVGRRFGIDSFREKRKAAQTEAFRRMHKRRKKEITLRDIYECLEHVDVAANDLLKAEYELEIDLVRPDPFMMELFMKSVADGKTVVITSDMYLPVDYFRNVLAKHAIPMVPLFISSERNATKRDAGELFDTVIAEMDVCSADVLHIGDNVHSDVVRAEEKGLKAFHYRKMSREPVTNDPGFQEASLIRSACARQYADGYQNNAEELGFLYGGPLIVAYLDWIAEQGRKDGIDRYLFIARDGYNMMAVADLYAKNRLSNCHYFYGSRTVFALASMHYANYPAFIDYLLSGSLGLSPFEVIERIGVQVPSRDVMEAFGLGDDIHIGTQNFGLMERFLYAYKEEILRVCSRNRRGLFYYLNSIGIEKGERVALVDVGWAGSTQRYFEKAIEEYYDIDVFGYYLSHSREQELKRAKETMKMRSYVHSNGFSEKVVHELYRRRQVIEVFFSAPHNAVIGFDVSDDRKLRVIEEPDSEFTRRNQEISRNILGGMKQFVKLFAHEKQKHGMAIEHVNLMKIFIEFILRDEIRNYDLLRKIRNFDGWGKSRNVDNLLCELMK